MGDETFVLVVTQVDVFSALFHNGLFQVFLYVLPVSKDSSIILEMQD
jgi:hypothetical protein